MSDDEIPKSVSEWMQDAEEGEIRMRLQCNLCGCIKQGTAIIPEGPLRDQIASFIRDMPDETLGALREAISFAGDWQAVNLADGGVIDMCPDCVERSPHSPWRTDAD